GVADRSVATPAAVRRKAAEGGVEWLKAQANLLEVVGAVRLVGRLPDLLHRRKQQANQNANDGDHHQELHKGEAPGFCKVLGPHCEKAPWRMSFKVTLGNPVSSSNNLAGLGWACRACLSKYLVGPSPHQRHSRHCFEYI